MGCNALFPLHPPQRATLMSRFTSKQAWGKVRYAYVPGLRLRVQLAPDEELPTGTSTAWVSLGSKALKIDIATVDRADTPWGHEEGQA